MTVLKLANRAYAYLASHDGDRTKKAAQMANLRQRRGEVRSVDLFYRLGCVMSAFVRDLCGFFSWRPKSNTMCINYGHVYDKNGAGAADLCCRDCGAVIESLDDVRGATAARKRNGHESRSVIRW